MQLEPRHNSPEAPVGSDRTTKGVFDALANGVALKTAEAADILGVSQNTLRAWAEAGKIAVRRNPANRYRLFKRSDLQKFLAVSVQFLFGEPFGHETIFRVGLQ